MRVRALGSQLTFYDEDFNVIGEYPEREEYPDIPVRTLDIIEFEDRLMGIDPNAKPDFFIDFETDERFIDDWDDEDYEPKKLIDKEMVKMFLGINICVFAFIGFGYWLGGILLENNFFM